MTPIQNDPVNHPTHYTSHPSGVECIEITRTMPFNLGSAVKYVWREELKNGVEDLRKSLWYIEDHLRNNGSDDRRGGVCDMDGLASILSIRVAVHEAEAHGAHNPRTAFFLALAHGWVVEMRNAVREMLAEQSPSEVTHD